MALLSQGRRQSRRRRPAAGHTGAASPGPVRRPLAEGQAPFARGSALRPRRVSDGDLGAHRTESTAFDEKASGAGMACTPRAAIRRDAVVRPRSRRVSRLARLLAGCSGDTGSGSVPVPERLIAPQVRSWTKDRVFPWRTAAPWGAEPVAVWSHLSLGRRRPGLRRNCPPAPAVGAAPCSMSVRRGVSGSSGTPHARSEVLGPDRHA